MIYFFAFLVASASLFFFQKRIKKKFFKRRRNKNDLRFNEIAAFVVLPVIGYFYGKFKHVFVIKSDFDWAKKTENTRSFKRDKSSFVERCEVRNRKYFSLTRRKSDARIKSIRRHDENILRSHWEFVLLFHSFTLENGKQIAKQQNVSALHAEDMKQARRGEK